MFRMRSLFVVAIAAVTLGACEDAGLGPVDSGGDFDINVGAGTKPTYSWQGGAAETLDVFRENGVTPAWAIADIANAAIGSPVVHGNVPSGAIEVVDNEKTLTPGVRYRVTIKLGNGQQAFREFTP